jgi:hypothetical protein
VRIHDIQDENGRVQAFDVPTGGGGSRRDDPGLSPVQGAPLRVQGRGVPFLVHEHWAESDRYWVGPAEAGWCPQLAVIRETFARARPFLWFVRF